jgi:hypothetical protein
MPAADGRRRLVALGWLAAWAASLPLPAAYNENGVTHGFDVLALGWLGPLMLHFGWFANLLLPVAMATFLFGAAPSRSWPQLVGWMILLCGLNSLAWFNIPDDSGPNPIERYGLGYYSWMLATIGGGGWLIALGWSQRRPSMPMDEK